MCSWQVVVCSGPCAMPLIIRPHEPQMPEGDDVVVSGARTPAVARHGAGVTAALVPEVMPDTEPAEHAKVSTAQHVVQLQVQSRLEKCPARPAIGRWLDG
ncbi:hypothetical protein SAMN05661080_01287 [Modestobacter sp. DSM 44400]|nr:hypothetical protein SAMN05661080_01287 [Modestobacter sp. DSM 44400]